MTRGRRPLVAAVLVHVGLSAAHGWAHAVIPVRVPTWQFAYAVGVILLAPVVGAAVLLAGRSVAGGWIALLSGVAALAFEAPFHFVVAGADHIATVEAVPAPFASTAWPSAAEKRPRKKKRSLYEVALSALEV